MRKKIWWGDFTARDFENLNADETIAVLPVAATEQHGPHLPVCTDEAIMAGMLETAIALLPDGLDIRILPIQAVGKSDEHGRVSGTLTVSPATLIAHWCDLGASAARAGIRKFVIVTAHGGNEEVMGIVTRDLRARHAMLAVKTSWGRFALPEGLYSETERRFGIHGGDYETSLMLHFRPDLVDMGRAANVPSKAADAQATFKHLGVTGPHAFAWLAGDLNPAGVVGEAAKATAEKGRATARHQARGFVELLSDIRAAKLDDWLSR